MKGMVNRAIRGEDGKVLILVLVLLVVGGLLLGPLLGLMSTGLAAGQVHERKAAELYAADAGVEDAIWKITNPDLSDLPHKQCGDKSWTHTYPSNGHPAFEVNARSVAVIIDYLLDGVFRITSTATTDERSSTTIVAYLEGTFEQGAVEYEDGEEIGNVDGVVYAAGNLTVGGNVEGDAVVYVEGNLVVSGRLENNAQIYVKGDLTLDGGNIENDAIICVGGDLTRNGKFENDVQVYVEGNLVVSDAIEDGARVCVQGNIVVAKIEETDRGTPTVCAGGDLIAGKIEGGYVYVGGEMTVAGDNRPSGSGGFEDCPLCSPSCPECRICCECPLEFTAEPGQWSGWTVGTYNIGS